MPPLKEMVSFDELKAVVGKGLFKDSDNNSNSFEPK